MKVFGVWIQGVPSGIYTCFSQCPFHSNFLYPCLLLYRPQFSEVVWNRHVLTKRLKGSFRLTKGAINKSLSSLKEIFSFTRADM
jgi:hypothetical protein